jgi:hypothetical protein
VLSLLPWETPAGDPEGPDSDRASLTLAMLHPSVVAEARSPLSSHSYPSWLHHSQQRADCSPCLSKCDPGPPTAVGATQQPRICLSRIDPRKMLK